MIRIWDNNMRTRFAKWLDLAVWGILIILAFIAALGTGYGVYSVFISLGVPGLVLISLAFLMLFISLNSFYLRWWLTSGKKR